MTTVTLHVDQDIPAAVRTEIAPLITRFGLTEVVYGYRSADPHTGPRCGRCNTLLHIHWWQLVDGDDVIDCGRPS